MDERQVRANGVTNAPQKKYIQIDGLHRLFFPTHSLTVATLARFVVPKPDCPYSSKPSQRLYFSTGSRGIFNSLTAACSAYPHDIPHVTTSSGPRPN
jgi:hypothetical protein